MIFRREIDDDVVVLMKCYELCIMEQTMKETQLICMNSVNKLKSEIIV